MPMLLIRSKAHKVGKVASPLPARLLSMLVPIVPITHLFNIVIIRNKGVIGTYKRVYARKSFNRLGMDMGIRRFLCKRN